MFIAKENFYLFGTGVKQKQIPSAGGAKVMKSEEKGTNQHKGSAFISTTRAIIRYPCPLKEQSRDFTVSGLETEWVCYLQKKNSD